MYTLDEAIQEEKWFLKDIIIEFEEEINNKAFDVVYDNIDSMYLKSAFTALLLKNNIKPLVYMNKMPLFFAYELNIKELVIPNNITNISYGAFEGCNDLTNIIILGSITIIDSSAFSNCISLTNISIPKSVESILSYAFDGCINLTDVYYEGSEEDWENIEIKIGNDDLLNANIHYNS